MGGLGGMSCKVNEWGEVFGSELNGVLECIGMPYVGVILQLDNSRWCPAISDVWECCQLNDNEGRQMLAGSAATTTTMGLQLMVLSSNRFCCNRAM